MSCWGERSDGLEGNFSSVAVNHDGLIGLRTSGTLASHGVDDVPLGTFVEVSAGYDHFCARSSDGQVDCFGRRAPYTEDPVGTFTKVRAGYLSTCAIDSEGALLCWCEIPSAPVCSPPEGRFVDVSSGSSFACAIDLEGALHCWGRSPVPEWPREGRRFVAVGLGFSHACALDEDGEVHCWGGTRYLQGLSPGGQFSLIAASEWTLCAQRASGGVLCAGGESASIVTEESFEAIAVGIGHGCGLRASGELACWGLNNEGQASPPDHPFQSVRAGGHSTCGIDVDGLMRCFGDNAYQTTEPVLAVDVSESWLCVIDESGAPGCFVGGASSAPPARYRDIFVGEGRLACGLTDAGDLACWTLVGSEPSIHTGPYTRAAVGDEHVCALDPTGQITCFDSGGEIDPAWSPPEATYVDVAIVTISPPEYGCGLTNTGELRCFGSAYR
jgi:hypothetical protein